MEDQTTDPVGPTAHTNGASGNAADDWELRFIVDNIPALLSYIDRDQVFRRANRTYSEWLGLVPEEIVGKSLAEVAGEPHRTTAQPYVARTLKGERVSFDSEIRDKNGRRREIAVEYSPDIRPDGSVAGFVALVHDVTERREQEKALHRASQLLRSHLENTPLGLVEFDSHVCIVRWSRRAEEIFGWTLDEVKGRQPKDFGWTDDTGAAAVEQLVDELRSGKLPFSVRVVRNCRRDGSVVHCEWYSSTLFDSNGEVESILCLIHDVTSRVQALEALRLSDERFRAALTGSPVIVFSQDQNLRYTWIHSAGGRFRAEAIVGRTDHELCDFDEDAEALDALKREAVESGKRVRGEMRVRQSGAEFYFDIAVEPMRNGRGEVEGITGAAVDTTARRQMENALRQANEALVRANAELEEFAYVASHDLQEPLRAINVYTQLLLRRYGPALGPEAHEYGRFIRDGANRMEALIHDLLSYSRTIHGDEPEVQRVSASEAIERARAALDRQIRDTGARIVVEPLPAVMAESIQLTVVFQNLLSNALKYHRAGTTPEIHVWAEREGADQVFRIADNGIGFDPAYAERIFGLFKRLHRTEYPGTGLGLAICKRVLERFGGTIWAESHPGRGSVFYFRLPAAGPEN